MTGRYKAYPDYKDSGVELLGNIPEHWEAWKFKHCLLSALLYGANEAALDENKSDPRYIRITDMNEDGSLRDETYKSLPQSIAKDYLLSDGDILLARSGATVGKSFLYKSSFGTSCFAGYLIKASCNNKVLNSRYAYWFCQSDQFWKYISGSQIQSTIQNVSAEKYGEMKLPFSSEMEEQQKIANFLDHETAKIDTLITKQEKLIELLKEKRQAVISHAVTKGLNPDAPMKDSGVEWLGEMPEHWSVGRLKNVLRIRNGKDYKHIEVESGGYPVYGSGGIFKRSSEYLFDGESVLFGRKGTIDKPLVVKGKFWTVDTMFYSELNKYTDAHYVHSQSTLFPFDLLSTNTALPSMTQEDLLELGFVIPPFEEQLDISKAISKQNNKFANIIEKASKQIDLMKERKTALISAAVTGKIDVRDWKVQEVQE
ncbi:restriction endonuclease subunit S [Vibrio pectenicida]|uniref:Restriction endonuclease subunit S n=1 Tax=Vibrio pectenicida TaxID=62763 RepID=A0A7Y3ZWK3_9VIBR|nr:restriction endonuclease subunit S [Vibrio pectenicida]NOH70238.1 restriction endonuclease subunit S [Vibrio pectenicida]